METTVDTILIASDSPTDAARVKSLLHAEFSHVYISTGANKGPGDFVRFRPDVLVLAFDTLEKSERYYLELNRMCEEVAQRPLRTVILCNRHEIAQVYELCKKGYFDDYILFWPMTDDAPRLAMSIHHALHNLAALKTGGPTVSEFAAQARRLAELGTKLERKVVQGGLHIEIASQALVRASQEVDTALDRFSRRLVAGATPDSAVIEGADGIQREISRVQREEVQPQFSAAIETTMPLKQWAQDLKQDCAPLLKSALALHAMAERVRPTVLVVDDDEVQRVIIDNLLTAHDYNLLFARDGMEALIVLRDKRPDLILMDMLMPNMSGLETTRRVKEIPDLARTPVIMITGKSGEDVVADCKKAGAVDFVVKPFDPAVLVDKINRALKADLPP